MSMTGGKKVLSVALCFALIAITMPIESGAVTFYQDHGDCVQPCVGAGLSGTRRANDHGGVASPGCAHCALSGRPGGSDSQCRNVSRPDRGRQLLARSRTRPYRYAR